ncbi:hypothetical protein HY995_00715 [Candidatus Micrarchaeota archaeon]|nr:hypothetical protein [Candidatus Micrarchaeota archaeon]
MSGLAAMFSRMSMHAPALLSFLELVEETRKFTVSRFAYAGPERTSTARSAISGFAKAAMRLFEVACVA